MTCTFEEMRYALIKEGMADPEEEFVQCSECDEPLYKNDYPSIEYIKKDDELRFLCPICGYILN